MSSNNCKKEEISEGATNAFPWQLFQQVIWLKTRLLTVYELLVSDIRNTDKSICRFQVLLVWFYVCVCIRIYETKLSFMARDTSKTFGVLSQQI